MRKKENEFVDYQSAAFAKKRAQDQLEKTKKAFKVAIFAQIAVFAFPVIFSLVKSIERLYRRKCCGSMRSGILDCM